MPTSTVSVRCMGDSAPGAISVKRTPTPLAGGGVRTGRAVGSGSEAAIGTGTWSVIHVSWNAAVPMSSVFGTGVSESTTDFPAASWPVTIRRGAAMCASLLYLMANSRNCVNWVAAKLLSLTRTSERRPSRRRGP